MIPVLDLQTQYQSIKDEVDAAIMEVVGSGRFVLGPVVSGLEEEIAAYCECGHAVGVASGTDALRLSLAALEIGPGDEVITTPFTFIATVNAILFVGAKPVLVDIEEETFNVNPALIEATLQVMVPPPSDC